MADKPGDFLIGVVNFFAILLPGAVAAFFGMGAAADYVAGHQKIFGEVPRGLFGDSGGASILAVASHLFNDTRGWVVFAVASYLLGQFIYLLGSLLDELYNLARKFFKADWLRECADRVKARALAGWVGRQQAKKRGVLKWLNKKWDYNEGLFRRAREITDRDLGCPGEEVVKPYQWAKASVQIHAPGAADEIHRLEADQKFFRGLMVVLVLICVLFPLKYGVAWGELLPYVVLLLLSFWRYIDQRRKGQDLAYTYLMALKAPAPAAAEKPAGDAGTPADAAARN